MRDDTTNAPAAATVPLPSTTVAFLDGRAIYFTDLVYDGDVVDVFDTFEQAEDDEGPHRKMRVRLDEDDWLLEAV